jgi:hypothetical protein
MYKPPAVIIGKTNVNLYPAISYLFYVITGISGNPLYDTKLSNELYQ